MLVGLTALLAISLVVGACGGASTHAAVPRPRRQSNRVTPTTTSVPADTETTTPTPNGRLGNGHSVVLAFGGDVHFEGALRAKLMSDPDHVLDPVAPVLRGADLAMVNLESAITTRGTPEHKDYTFRAPPTAFTALAASGVDVATMANNHGRDFGNTGLQDSLAAISSAPLRVIGIGTNASAAFAPARFTPHGQRVTIIAATDVLDGELERSWTATDTQAGLASAKDTSRLLAAVRSARADSDTVVVYLHWGVEGQSCPSARQRQLARALVDAGADLIVGSHSHRQEGGGRLGDAFVDYGLGNFAFYNETGSSGVTGILVVSVTGRRVDGYTWLPARIRGGVPTFLAANAVASDVSTWNALRNCSGLAP